MVSHEELAYQKVARLVVRYFYDVEETLVMEVLLQAPRKAGAPDEKTGAVVYHPTMQLDDVVAERLNLGTKQVRKHLSRMFQDRLVMKTRGGADKNAAKRDPALGQDPKAVEGFAAGELNAADVRFFWGIDYEVLVDAVHFKLDAMKRALDAMHTRANAEQQYSCPNPNCKAVVSALELTPEMMDFASGSFKCQAYGCGHELDEVDNSKETGMIDAWRAELRSFNHGPSLAPALTTRDLTTTTTLTLTLTPTLSLSLTLTLTLGVPSCGTPSPSCTRP